jgi:threonine dehydrogenase-like Zn-dependent dehydrogenase
VIKAGVCETDLQLIKGYMGFRGVLGHEFVGVAESGPLPDAVWSAKSTVRVECETCRKGLPTTVQIERCSAS